MVLRAILDDGDEVFIEPTQGTTLEDLTAHLTAESLTGSAVPLAEARIRTTDGRVIAYSDVNVFIEDEPF